MIARRILPEDVACNLARTRTALARMAAHSDGCFLVEDIAQALLADRMQLWLAEVEDDSEGMPRTVSAPPDAPVAPLACVMVSEIIVYPRRKALRLVGLVGIRPVGDWRHLIVEVEAEARRLGCNRLEALVAADKFSQLLPGMAPGHRLYAKDF